MLAPTGPGHLRTAASPEVHKGKLSWLNFSQNYLLTKFTWMVLSSHLQSCPSNPSYCLQKYVAKSGCLLIFSSVALILCLYLILHLPHQVHQATLQLARWLGRRSFKIVSINIIFRLWQRLCLRVVGEKNVKEKIKYRVFYQKTE